MPLAEKRRRLRGLRPPLHIAAASACAGLKAFSKSRVPIPKDRNRTSIALCLSRLGRTCSSIPVGGGCRIVPFFGYQNARLTATYLLHALDFLHANGIAHTDIKLDSIQIMLPDEQDSYLDTFCAAAEKKSSPILSRLGGKVADTPVLASREMEQDELGYPILCDLGSAVFDDEGYPGVVQALPYRAPEVILSAAWDHKVDIWNFGVLVWELLFDEHLFGNTDERGSMESMIRYTSVPPKSFLERCRRPEAFFDENGEWLHGTIDTVRLEDRIEEGTLNPEFFDFLRCALQWDPRERSSAAQLLDHSWLR